MRAFELQEPARRTLCRSAATPHSAITTTLADACPPEQMLTGIGGTVMTKDRIKPPSSVFKQSVEALIAAGIIAEAMAALRSNSANAGFMRGLTFMVSALLRHEAALMHILAPKAPRLLEAVAQAMAVHKTAVGVQANVCAIFSNLSTDVAQFDLTSALLERAMDEARAAVRPVCAAMLAHPGAENIQRSGSRALQFFGEADLGKAVAAAGGAQVLTRILKAGPRPGREVGFGPKKQVIADEVFGRTTMALAELTESRDFVQAFVVAGGVPAVLARINVNEPPVRCASLCTVLEHVALGLDPAQRKKMLPRLRTALPEIKLFIEAEHMRERHLERSPDLVGCVPPGAVLPQAKKAYRRLLGVGEACTKCSVRTDKPLGCSGCSGNLELDVTTWYCGEKCQRKDWSAHKDSCEFAAEATVPETSASGRFGFGLNIPTDPVDMVGDGFEQMMQKSIDSIMNQKPKRPALGTPQLPLESFASADAMRAWVLEGGDVTLRDDGGCTLLFYATGCATGDSEKFCDLELAQLLIQRGVPLNARTYRGGDTLLKMAILPVGLRKDPDLQLQTVQLLLNNNADTSIGDSMGETPVCGAMMVPLIAREMTIRYQFDDPILAALLKAGASPHVGGVAGSSPVLGACLEPSLAAVRLLLQAGARPDMMALGLISEVARLPPLADEGENRPKNRCGVAAAIKLLLEQFKPLTAAEQLSTAALLGCCVVIGGLQSRPELNGRHGNPIYYIAKSMRYSVLLDGCGAELVSLKPSNLTALPHGDYGNFMLHGVAPAARQSVTLADQPVTTAQYSY